LGALVAMASVVSDPGSARTLTLVGPAGLSNRPPALIRRSGGGEMVTDAYRYEGSMYALFSTVIDFPLTDRRSLYRDVARHHVPTLLLWGEHDKVTPIASLPEARALLGADTATAVIPHSGHMAPLEQPAAVAEQLTDFISRTSRP
jgi:pimeloyl-ACP methyl ester carboxylesterase